MCGCCLVVGSFHFCGAGVEWKNLWCVSSESSKLWNSCEAGCVSALVMLFSSVAMVPAQPVCASMHMNTMIWVMFLWYRGSSRLVCGSCFGVYIGGSLENGFIYAVRVILSLSRLIPIFFRGLVCVLTCFCNVAN